LARASALAPEQAWLTASYLVGPTPSRELNEDFARLGHMIRRSKLQNDEWAPSVIWIVSAIIAIIGCFWFLIFDLSQPIIYSNPGLAAYTPPPGTRLLPLPRRSDAPELADLANEPPSPLTALARALDQKEVMSEPPARKRPRVTAGENEQRTSDYGQQWNYGYGDRNSNRASSGPHKMSGGPKSSF
jgi:hypothetical protein